jgi:hypothetical protein
MYRIFIILGLLGFLLLAACGGKGSGSNFVPTIVTPFPAFTPFQVQLITPFPTQTLAPFPTPMPVPTPYQLPTATPGPFPTVTPTQQIIY